VVRYLRLVGDCFMVSKRIQSLTLVLSHLRSILAVIVAVLLIAVMSPIHAQSPASPSFEVATVKSSNPNDPRPASLKFSRDSFSATGMTLKELIAIAYHLTYGADKQVSGGPDWIDSEKFDIQAKEDEAVSTHLNNLSAKQRGDEYRLMIQALLAERFKLKVHHETKELPTYTLVVTKNGPKLKLAVLDPHLRSNIPQSRINVMGKGFLEGHDSDVTLLVKTLSLQPEIGGRTIVDKTGLSGKYDFTLKWAPDFATDAPPSEEETSSSFESRPTFFSALQEQLGLRLIPAKSPISVIVVDYLDRPSEN
jgi:uncharacterized protein (TIGR03435 family)